METATTKKWTKCEHGNCQAELKYDPMWNTSKGLFCDDHVNYGKFRKNITKFFSYIIFIIVAAKTGKIPWN